jgi:hypothetical protein
MLDERDENHNAERYLSLLLFTGHQQAVERGRASHQRLVPAHGVSSWARGGERTTTGPSSWEAQCSSRHLPVRFAPTAGAAVILGADF